MSVSRAALAVAARACVLPLLLLAALYFLKLCERVEAQELQCQPPDAVVESITASLPIEKMIVLDSEQAARVGAWYDSLPPESDFHFDFAIVLRHVQHKTGLLLGKDGLACKAILISDENMPALLAAIMGTDASLPLILVQGAPAIHHHEGMSESVDRFYSTWFRPDHPQQSCCDKLDCYPTEARYRNGGWEAQQRETGNWIHVPPAVIEHNRDGPDSQSHICMQASHVDPTVFCFILGGGT